MVCVDKGELFGWGNTEYNQLNSGHQSDEMQVCVARHVPLSDIGKVVKVAAAGSSCALINGNYLPLPSLLLLLLSLSVQSSFLLQNVKKNNLIGIGWMPCVIMGMMTVQAIFRKYELQSRFTSS